MNTSINYKFLVSNLKTPTINADSTELREKILMKTNECIDNNKED